MTKCEKCGLDHAHPESSREGLIIIACAIPKFKLYSFDGGLGTRAYGVRQVDPKGREGDAISEVYAKL